MTKSTSTAVARDPRFAGLRKPAAAKTSEIVAQPSTWQPVPTQTQNSMGRRSGGRKTSACTSFQPLSSRSSAFSSSDRTLL